MRFPRLFAHSTFLVKLDQVGTYIAFLFQHPGSLPLFLLYLLHLLYFQGPGCRILALPLLPRRHNQPELRSGILWHLKIKLALLDIFLELLNKS